MSRDPITDFVRDTDLMIHEADVRVLEALDEAPVWDEDGRHDPEETLKPSEADAFADMLDWLQKEPRRKLSDKQREWAWRRASDLGIAPADERQAEMFPGMAGAPVPRGREVAPAPVLQHLPKRPPGRR